MGAPMSLVMALMSFAAQLFFVVGFTATFRLRGCGKNGSTIAVSLMVPILLWVAGCFNESVMLYITVIASNYIRSKKID